MPCREPAVDPGSSTRHSIIQGIFVNLLQRVLEMQAKSPLVFYLSGAGGGKLDFDVLRDSIDDQTRFEVIGYPGWRRYVSDRYSAEVLIAELAAQIDAKAEGGPIHIIGLSIGGHFAYSIGLYLQAMGREIEGICAIDSFMFATSDASTGWKGRALSEIVEIIRRGRFFEFIRFLRSRFWRALARLAGDRLQGLLRKMSSSNGMNVLSAVDPIFEEELSMRLLIKLTAPWIASLDQQPVALKTQAVLLRTDHTASSDAAWRRRCPNINITEIPGKHHNLFEAENVGSLRSAFLTATSHWRPSQ
jgi:thioesterase domain-containing protein